MIPVILFNANTLGVTIGVNGASSTVWIGPATPQLGWQPQSNGTAVQMTLSGSAAPNVLAVGTNSLAITPAKSPQPRTVTVNLPGSIQWIAVQLYVFFDSTTSTSWAILNQGQFVTGGLSSAG